ncbi:MAG TPA: radical SAM protein [Terriglobales bacterium]|nr:radical SAM protein [Terriglobales bacterium]
MVSTRDVVRAWGALLRGKKPALSIEITKECPLRCPGCYAFAADHVGRGTDLKQLHDLRGEALIEGVTALVRRLRPLHVSLVGGDPLVRYRELEVLVPRLLAMGVFLQVVTSAFRPLPAAWAGLQQFELVVSVDGLAPDHDRRRHPATYERILRHIAGHQVVIHCTITAPMARRAGYLDEFLQTWSANPDIKKIWMSIFTPQRGDALEEIPSPAERQHIVADLYCLRERYPKLDMPRGLVAMLEHPPASPQVCVFARATTVVSADLHSPISPCQFGGDPDCSRCGCFASMGLAAIAEHRLAGSLTAGHIFHASADFGDRFARWLPQQKLPPAA